MPQFAGPIEGRHGEGSKLCRRHTATRTNTVELMADQSQTLSAFGWTSHFQSQLDDDDDHLRPVRVVAVHRNALEVAAPGYRARVPPLKPDDDGGEATVGDWLLLKPDSSHPRRLLKRMNALKRRAAGTGRHTQLIAANIDTLFIVTSCNRDFNVARLERYLALAREAAVTPAVILTKADLIDDPRPFVAATTRVAPGLLVEPLDARDPNAVERLSPWCGPGQTVALLGSSGVGKSTLINTLSGRGVRATTPVRADDDKGRHTTASRSLHPLPTGGWLVDTPGMRELQLADAELGVAGVFSDIVELARGCRFANCGHRSEPGCAVLAAIAAGTLDPERLRRFHKLAAEESHNSEALHERRARQRVFGKMVRAVMREKKTRLES